MDIKRYSIDIDFLEEDPNGEVVMHEDIDPLQQELVMVKEQNDKLQLRCEELEKELNQLKQSLIKERYCIDCGRLFKVEHGNQIRCNDCKSKYHMNYMRERRGKQNHS
jgi:DNA-directed RNA polymerase subunit RPC12/RpoP